MTRSTTKSALSSANSDLVARLADPSVELVRIVVDAVEVAARVVIAEHIVAELAAQHP